MSPERGDFDGYAEPGGGGGGDRGARDGVREAVRALGPAEFSLKFRDDEARRTIYTFCMCPGGVVVNASHGGGGVAINGARARASTRARRVGDEGLRPSLARRRLARPSLQG